MKFVSDKPVVFSWYATDTTEILLKVALNTITVTHPYRYYGINIECTCKSVLEGL
jgi:hypothetical protein